MNDGIRPIITESEMKDSLLLSVFLCLSSEPQLPQAVTRVTGEVWV